jgi:hypothetical protein
MNHSATSEQVKPKLCENPHFAQKFFPKPKINALREWETPFFEPAISCNFLLLCAGSLSRSKFETLPFLRFTNFALWLPMC